MKKIVYFILLSISFHYLGYSQEYLRYLPLKTGNVWVYVEHFGYPYSGCYNFHKYSVTGITQINGKTYYQISAVTNWSSLTCQQGAPNMFSRLYSNMLIRLDSSSGNIYISETCGNTPGIILDSLKSSEGDSASTCIGSNHVFREICDTSTVSIFGMNKKTKSFFLPHAGGAEHQSYALDIGMYSSSWSESTWWWSETLQGCVLNGVVYGDTNTIVGVPGLGQELPVTFSLSQNYPNPFNPKSNIKFQIAKTGFVKLVVFDASGKEISQLINEQLSPGTYEAEWDGTNYPSGVYFYKLITTGYSETKKMVLIK